MKTLEYCLVQISVLTIKGYRLLLAPFLGGHCRFYPSCSIYMEQSIKNKGLIKGGVRGLRRILSCHPLHPGGYDPVQS